MLGKLKTLLAGSEDAAPPAKPSVPLTQLEPGSGLSFSNATLIPELRGKKAMVQSVRTYRFGETTTVSYLISVDSVESLILTIAEDEQGYYLGVSRELNADQQHAWFDRDALSFFTEPSSAKTLKARVTDAQFPGWVAPKYVKAIDLMKGTLTQGRLSTSDAARKTLPLNYSLLVNEDGDKALEIEVYPELKAHRIFVTVYRPADDIVQITQPIPHIPTPDTKAKPEVKTEAKPKSEVAAPTPVAKPVEATKPAAAVLTAAPKAPTPAPAKPRAVAPSKETFSRPDFRRLERSDHAHIVPRTPTRITSDDENANIPPLPSFLTSEGKEPTRSRYLALDEVLPPEIERVRCDMATAKILIDESIKRGVRVRDLLRHMTGLSTPAHDEVLFEMPLSDDDYIQLAQRYQLRPNMRSEIRSKLMEELQRKLRKING